MKHAYNIYIIAGDLFEIIKFIICYYLEILLKKKKKTLF